MKINITKEKLILAAGIALGLFLRAIMIPSSSVWLDEAFSINMASHSLSGMIGVLRNDAGVPLYYILLKGWISFFGNSDLACAGFSVLLSACTPLVVYLAARRILGQKVAWIAFFLAIINPLSLEQSTNIRFYALLEFLTAVQYYFFFRIIKNPVYSIGYIITGVAGFYTHSYFILVLFSQLAITAFYFRDALKRLFIMQLLIIPFTLPWMPVILAQSKCETFSMIHPLSGIRDAMDLFLRTIARKIMPQGSFDPLILILIALFAVISIYILVRTYILENKKLSQRGIMIAAICTAYFISVGAPIVISIWKPIFLISRYDVIAIILVELVIANQLLILSG